MQLHSLHTQFGSDQCITDMIEKVWGMRPEGPELAVPVPEQQREVLLGL
jgi:hypothetical protein